MKNPLWKMLREYQIHSRSRRPSKIPAGRNHRVTGTKILNAYRWNNNQVTLEMGIRGPPNPDTSRQRWQLNLALKQNIFLWTAIQMTRD